MNNSDSPLRSIFADALEIDDAQQRAAFLVRACGTDTALRLNIEELIKAQALAGRFLPDQPGASEAQAVLLAGAEALAPVASRLQVPITEKPGDVIGRYKLLQKIGEGGCGVVYMAEQEEPIRRKAALKVIKLGMDTKSVVARFEAERQALALMDHTNIAKVLDAGATTTGRPFFVMELVRGTRITHYCDQHKLSTRNRLELFIQVCQAVQHAHQKGIIHRDLKPSNILVTVNDGVAVPKVIDFGIAKATEGRLADQTLFTAFEQFLGTPAYMSPEQAAMTSLDIDARSDIYSLGVLLYELLTGKTPFDTQELVAAGLDELRRTIRETEPSRPSMRLSTLLDGELTTTARQRGIEAPKLIYLLRGDLDWIVMKCLEKDRARRYETANGLARDIQRHLDNEVVVARPPSSYYRFQRVVRRNKLAFAAGFAIAMALLAGTSVSTWQAVEATRARSAEVRQRVEAQHAQARAEAQQQRADAETQRFQRNVVRDYVANGTRLMNEGDLFTALLWYTEALRLDAGDAGREEPHRIRIASVLRQCPKLLNVLSHGTMVYHAVFSPDGGKVLTTSDDHTAYLWDATTGRQLLVLPHDGQVYDGVFSQDGLRIVTSSQDRTARVWETQTGRLLQLLKHPDTVWRSSFSPDGGLVVTACEKTAQLWDVNTGAQVRGPLIHEDFVGQVTFSPDGRLVATVAADATAHIWDVATGQPLFQRIHTANWANEFEVAFTPDGQRFATCEGSELHIWDSRTFKELSFPSLKMPGIEDIAFSPDGRAIVAGGDDFTVQVWDATTGQPRFSPPAQHIGIITSTRISPDGRRFATGGNDAVARLWSTRTGQPVAPPLKTIIHSRYVAFNPDGRRLLVKSCDQAARVWDMATSDSPGPYAPMLLNEHRLISPDGRYGLLQGESNIVWITDTHSGAKLAALLHTNEIVYVSFSRDGRTVITAAEERNRVSDMRNEILLWDVPSGRRLNTAAMDQPFELMYAAFSPDNRRLLTCGFDFSARLWDVGTGRPLSKPMRHGQPVSWGAFSPDGQSVVTVSRDKAARLWSAATGEPLTASLQHKAGVTGAFWSPDGKRLHTMTEDNHIQLWDIATGEPLGPPRRFQQAEARQTSPDAPASEQPNEALPRDDRPIADLLLLSQMLAVGRIDSDGNVVPLQLDELTSAWQLLHQRYPDQFAATPSEIAEWHLREAQDSDAEGNGAAVLFHLERALERRPQDQFLKQQRAEVAAALLKETNYAPYQMGLSQRIPARDLKAGSEQIDLTSHYNLALQDSLDQKEDRNNLAGLPSGLQTFGGLRFDVRGVIHLNGVQAKQAGLVYPQSVNGIRIGRKCVRLHFLHATDWGAEKGKSVVGHYILNYADGQSRELPIVFGRDLADWFLNAPAGANVPNSPAIMWTGSNPWATKYNCTIALYGSTFENPRPDMDVLSLDLVSTMTTASPFLVALTVE
jgi:WD40 repeat protein/serine/threonine protein kinase